MVLVWTSSLRYDGEDRLDITRSGHHAIGVILAPSTGLLYPYKQRRRRDRQAFEQYRLAYIAEMRISYQAHRVAWDTILSLDSVTLMCYCVNPAACHRTLAANLLVAASRGKSKYEGERATKENE